MKLTVQKRLASQVLKCSPKRVKLAPSRLADISKGITKSDIAGLVGEGLIEKIPARGVSRVRARVKAAQRRKGLQRGPGKRKGKKTALVNSKSAWMIKIRLQRSFLKELKEKKILEQAAHKDLYRKAGGGFFRSKRHIKIYIDDHNLARKE